MLSLSVPPATSRFCSLFLLGMQGMIIDFLQLTLNWMVLGIWICKRMKYCNCSSLSHPQISWMQVVYANVYVKISMYRINQFPSTSAVFKTFVTFHTTRYYKFFSLTGIHTMVQYHPPNKDGYLVFRVFFYGSQLSFIHPLRNSPFSNSTTTFWCKKTWLGPCSFGRTTPKPMVDGSFEIR